MFLLHSIPSKAIPKAPFELWTNKTIRIYNPQEKKLDARKINGYFVSYPKKIKRV